MGQRHLRGACLEGCTITVVDPSREALDRCAALVPWQQLNTYSSLLDVPRHVAFDIAIIATTAAGRRENLSAIIDRGVKNVLAEKPLEQSRAETRAFVHDVKKHKLNAWCNHYRRNLKSFEPLREKGGPFVISVSSGAMGLAMNGIHWIDFALHITGQRSGRLLYGEIAKTVINSGRGAQYRDYGGFGVFGFPDGSRLSLSCAADSSAPTAFSIVSRNEHWIVDQDADRALVHYRPDDVSHPTYLYGKDYLVSEKTGLETVDLSALTRTFVRSIASGIIPPQPRVDDVVQSYELLFDLLECSGETKFSFA